jgi:hypothetical protein
VFIDERESIKIRKSETFCLFISPPLSVLQIYNQANKKLPKHHSIEIRNEQLFGIMENYAS